MEIKNKIIEYGINVFESEINFFDWLMTPNKSLGGLIPYNLLDTKDEYKILDILGRIEHGVYS